jgi:hypothetical protein
MISVGVSRCCQQLQCTEGDFETRYRYGSLRNYLCGMVIDKFGLKILQDGKGVRGGCNQIDYISEGTKRRDWL